MEKQESNLPEHEKYLLALSDIGTIFKKYGFDKKYQVEKVLDAAKGLFC